MLGIDYSSSEDEEQVIDDSNNTLNRSEDSTNGQTVNKSIVNPFDANNYELSSSEDDVEDFKHKTDSKANQLVDKSDPIGHQSNESPIECSLQNRFETKSLSIFNNPFKDEETKELSQLERHVKLTDNKTLSGQIENNQSNKSKTICWSYHKHKKCRFGNRCRYRHNDSDFIDTKNIKRSHNSSTKTVGITDSLIPPKRAMKAYYSQQNII